VALSPGEREQWRARSRALASERYSWDAVTSSYLSILQGPSPAVR
jgi:hypothetical protein